jgi:two-component sensor histidine kinase
MANEQQSLAKSNPDDGCMARRVNEFDWASTPLGPAEDWPPELKTVVRMILESGFPSAVVWGREFTTIYNDAFRPILGDKPEALGRSFADIWSEAWEEIGPIALRAFGGQETYIENFPLTIERGNGPERAWFTFCYSPLRLRDGTVAGMIDTVIETTDTVGVQADLSIVAGELGHRLKNTLALVQAIAAQTFKDVAETGKVTAFQQRIAALGHAHELLLRQNWSAASLRDLVTDTLAPLDGLEQIAIDGPDLPVGSRAAVMLALMLHELATNAAKYGALSVPNGVVDLRWTVENGILRLRWRESGGPIVDQPSSRGFGSRLIERGLGASSAVRTRFLESGFEFDFDVPADELVGR